MVLQEQLQDLPFRAQLYYQNRDSSPLILSIEQGKVDDFFQMPLDKAVDYILSHSVNKIVEAIA